MKLFILQVWELKSREVMCHSQGQPVVMAARYWPNGGSPVSSYLHRGAFWLARSIGVRDLNLWSNNKNYTKNLEKLFHRILLYHTHDRKWIPSAAIYVWKSTLLFHNLTELFLAPGKFDTNFGSRDQRTPWEKGPQPTKSYATQTFNLMRRLVIRHHPFC